MAPQDFGAWVTSMKAPPPPGTPYSLPVPSSESEGRTPIYRHWRWVDKQLPDSTDPLLRTAHEEFEASVKKRPNAKCLGERPYDPVKKSFGNFEWQTYSQVAERRKNLGAGIVELHKKAGVTEEKYGVGLWCQNRPEWQIVGMHQFPNSKDTADNLQIWDACPSPFSPFQSTILSVPIPPNTSSTMPLLLA